MTVRPHAACKRLIAIGDIHGYPVLLKRLMEQISPTPDDRLVFLGDYIDRGPDSRGVIEMLIEIEERFPASIFLRGNHEQRLLDAMIEVGVLTGERMRVVSPAFARESFGSDAVLFMGNGGRGTLASYQINRLEDGFPPAHLDFLVKTSLCWRQAPFLFVHAGAYPGIPAEKQDPYVLLLDRYAPPGETDEIHVVGHRPTMDGSPYFEPGRFNLDTGAGHGKALTACDVISRKVWQVS
jgi:serine/threonine protein phosphatase 1